MTTATRVRLRVRVDPVACDAYGYCAELLPERVSLDEWGYPIVDGAPVDGELVALATRAATECPRRAILLERMAEHR
jgi:ferredoxin